MQAASPSPAALKSQASQPAISQLAASKLAVSKPAVPQPVVTPELTAPAIELKQHPFSPVTLAKSVKAVDRIEAVGVFYILNLVTFSTSWRTVIKTERLLGLVTTALKTSELRFSLYNILNRSKYIKFVEHKIKINCDGSR